MKAIYSEEVTYTRDDAFRKFDMYENAADRARKLLNRTGNATALRLYYSLTGKMLAWSLILDDILRWKRG